MGPGSRTAAEREQIDATVTAIRDSASKRRVGIMSTTRDLLPVILAWAVAVDAAELEPSADPGEPLLDLFAAGFQLEYRHEGIHIHHQSGWRIYQPPSRSSLV